MSLFSNREVHSIPFHLMRRFQRCCDGFTLERHYVAGGRRVPPPPSNPTFTAARPYYELRNHCGRRRSSTVEGTGPQERGTAGGCSARQAVIYLPCSPHLPACLLDRWLDMAEARAKVKCYARKERETSLLFFRPPSLRVRGSSAFLGVQYTLLRNRVSRSHSRSANMDGRYPRPSLPVSQGGPVLTRISAEKHESEIYHGSNYDSYKINCRPQEHHSAHTMIARPRLAGRVGRGV